MITQIGSKRRPHREHFRSVGGLYSAAIYDYRVVELAAHIQW
jgi:hypothetical protein